MFGLILSILSQPAVWIAAALGVTALVALAYVKGVPLALKVLSDGRTWMVALAAIAVIGTASINKKNEDLQAQVETMQVENDAYVDTGYVLQERAVKVRRRADEGARISQALTEAPIGEELDAVLDAIAAEDRSRAAADAGA